MRHHAPLTGFVTATVLLGITSWASGGDVTFRTVALRGDVAPGTGGLSYLFFFTPTINAAGQTAFVAFPSNFVAGIWSEGSGSLSLVARLSEQAPGTPAGVTFITFLGGTSYNRPLLNDAGQVTFQAGVTGPGVNGPNNNGVWSDESGTRCGRVSATAHPFHVDFPSWLS